MIKLIVCALFIFQTKAGAAPKKNASSNKKNSDVVRKTNTTQQVNSTIPAVAMDNQTTHGQVNQTWEDNNCQQLSTYFYKEMITCGSTPWQSIEFNDDFWTMDGVFLTYTTANSTDNIFGVDVNAYLHTSVVTKNR